MAPPTMKKAIPNRMMRFERWRTEFLQMVPMALRLLPRDPEQVSLAPVSEGKLAVRPPTVCGRVDTESVVATIVGDAPFEGHSPEGPFRHRE